MREEFEHERLYEHVSHLGRVIASMVVRGEPVSDALRQEYRDADAAWRKQLGLDPSP